MAEAILQRLGGGALEVRSAGTQPSVVNPLTIRALAEVGFDISAARSKSMIEFLDEPFDVIVTVCDDAREACPVYPGGGRRVHVPFDDPALARGDEAARLAEFRRMRAEIQVWAEGFASKLLDKSRAGSGLARP